MKKNIVVTAVIVAALAGGGYGIWRATKPKTDVPAATGAGGGSSKGPATVRTVSVETRPLPILLDAVGTVEADQSVAIRSEVNGVLQRINFREGDLVKAGQLLFQIDASAPQAEVEKARANLARDQATLAEARAQTHRLAPLAEKEYVTRQEYAQAAAQEEAASATVRADEAALTTVQIMLQRTRIHSPISGRAGVLNTKLGNLVSSSAQEPLVVINGVQSVMVAFSIPQQHLQEIRTRRSAGELTVEIRHEANADVLTTGTLALVDNAVDPLTGTIKLKARVPNQTEMIWPGELVAVRLILGIEENALVIPEAAVQPGQQGSFVYVADNGKARMQQIVIARQVGAQIVVASGLAAGEQVIVNAPQNLRPGGAIQLQDTTKAGAARDDKGAAKDPAARAANRGGKP